MVEGYFCEGLYNDIIMIEQFEGRIVLFYNKINGNFEKPSRQEYSKLKYSDTSFCNMITSKIEKEFGFEFQQIFTTKFEPRRYYTVYLLSYRNKSVYVLEFYDGSGGDYEFYIFDKLENALSEIFKLESKYHLYD